MRTWLQRSINFDISLDPWNILFGNTELRKSFLPVNVIYISAKYFIFHCASKKHSLNIYEYENFLKIKFVEQEYLSRIDIRQHDFCKDWITFANLFL